MAEQELAIGEAEEAFSKGRPGYYVVDVDAHAGVRGPFLIWETAVRHCAELNRGRPHARKLEVRVVGPPAPTPYDRIP